MTAPRELAALTADAFLLARFGPPGAGRPDGRAWERAASGLLLRPAFPRRQHASTLGLFGDTSASGALHELDGAGEGSEAGVWLEAKARGSLEKADVAAFLFKCLDLYAQAAHRDAPGVASARWWPVLMSSEPTSEAVRRSCAAWGVVLCDPVRVPLLTLMDTASQPVADMYLPEASLSELVCLGASAVAPMQLRWRIDRDRHELCTALGSADAKAIGELLYLQDELTADLLDMFDAYAPGYLWRRGAALADQLRDAVLAA